MTARCLQVKNRVFLLEAPSTPSVCQPDPSITHPPLPTIFFALCRVCTALATTYSPQCFSCILVALFGFCQVVHMGFLFCLNAIPSRLVQRLLSVAVEGISPTAA